MKLKNKILLILITLVLVITFGISNVFAVTDIVISDTETLTIPDELESFEYIAVLNRNGTYTVYWSNDYFYISTWNVNTEFAISSATTYYSLPYSSLTSENITNASPQTSVSGGGNSNQNFRVVASNFDMIDSDGNVTFAKNFSTNSNSSDSNDTILNNSIKSEDLDGVFSEILLILPVCLLVIIGFIAIRKAIDFLRNFLHKA